MAKKDKEEQTRDWELEIRSLGIKNAQLTAQLEEQRKKSLYIDIDLFIQEYAAALTAYMKAQYGENDKELHPHDLAASAATFADAWWAIYDNLDFFERWKRING